MSIYLHNYSFALNDIKYSYSPKAGLATRSISTSTIPLGPQSHKAGDHVSQNAKSLTELSKA